MHRRYRSALPVILLPLLTLAGCKDSKITVYRVPKEADAPDMPAGMAAASTAPVHWQTPAGWEVVPPSEMRTASFLVKAADGRKADVSIVTFPGDGGGELANVNRWRGQLHLAPVTAAQLPAEVQTIDTPAGRFHLVDLTSPTIAAEGRGQARMLAAFLQEPARIWFVKMTGADDVVGAQKPEFLALLKSISFPAASGAQSTNAPTEAVPGMPAAPFAGGAAGGGMNSMPVPTVEGPSLTWRAPAAWQVQPLGPMRKGSYLVTGAGGATADLSITAFPGEVGGDLANVNRWRGQVGLPQVDAAGLAGVVTSLDSGGLHFLVVDFSGGDGRRLLGAIVPYAGGTWFFKLLGPDALVEQAKPGFLAFLRTVRTP